MVRVLVIERDPLFRDMIQAMLERAGYRVRAVGSVSEAVGSLAHGPINAVIADLSLRDIFGHTELAAAVDAQGAIPTIGMADTQRQNVSGSKDIAAVIAKPIIESELLNVLQQVLTSGLT